MNFKRLISLLCALMMVLVLVPTTQGQVHAVEAGTITGLGVTGLEVSHGQLMQAYLDGDAPELDYYPAENPVAWSTSAVGNSVTIQFGGDKIEEDYAFAVGFELTFKNTSSGEAALKFNYSIPSDCIILGLSDGSYEGVLAAGESVTFTVFSPETTAVNELKITNISLSSGGDKTVIFETAENGTYTVNGNAINTKTEFTAPSGTEYVLSATAAEGYQFFGWHNGTGYISYETDTQYTVSEDMTIQPVFISKNTAVFGVGLSKFDNLSDADAYATNGANKLIILLNDGTVSGAHTVSAGNTLLIPYDDANTVHTSAASIAIQNGTLWENQPWEKPSAYRTLILAENASVTIEGALNVGGMHSPGPWGTVGAPSGNVGMIQMLDGSNITVNNGGVLYCWGYIYGGGTVTAKNGAMIHENIQFADFRGGNATAGIAFSFQVFPMTQYYVQNIEVAATFEYGSTERVWTSLFAASTNMHATASVDFIGSDKTKAMFVPEVGGTVTKTYIAAEDRLQIDIDGNGSINPLAVDMTEVYPAIGVLNTATFVMPITNNMTINVNSGIATLDQSLALLPGVVLTIAEGATLKLNQGEPLQEMPANGTLPPIYTGGHNLIIYDREQWFTGLIESEDGVEMVDTYFVYNGKRLQPVAFSVTGNYTRTEDDLKDAVVDINGTLITDGFIYTTVRVEYDEATESEVLAGSTPVISSKGTGKLVMNNGAGQDMLTMQATQSGSDPVFVYVFMSSVRLENPDGSYLDTMGAEQGAMFSYCAKCGQWHDGEACPAPEAVEITWIVNGEYFTSEFEYGTVPTYPDVTPAKARDGKFRYEFAGWSTSANGEVLESLPAATTDAVYYAVFEAFLIGDVDLDGDVDSNDLTMLASHVGKIVDISGVALLNADVDGDGDVDANDLTKHASYIAKIISNWNE